MRKKMGLPVSEPARQRL